MLIEQNEQGEIKGMGPEWACAGFGAIGHDYYTCDDCWSDYERHIAGMATSVSPPLVNI